jgi:hypothetical protein
MDGSPTSKAGDAWLTAELLQILQEEGMADSRGWVPSPFTPTQPATNTSA